MVQSESIARGKYSQSFQHGASLAVIPWRHGFPFFRQGYHRTGVQHAVAKEMVEFQADPVHRPVEPPLRIEQRVPLRRQHRQVLYVAPSQLRTEIRVTDLGYLVQFSSILRSPCVLRNGSRVSTLDNSQFYGNTRSFNDMYPRFELTRFQSLLRNSSSGGPEIILGFLALFL